MSRLTSDAEELVRAGRAALQPAEADRERVLQALLPQIGAQPTGHGGNPPPHPGVAAKLTAAKVSALLVGLGVVGGGLFVALRPAAPAHTPAAPAPRTAPAKPQRGNPVSEQKPAVLPAAPDLAPGHAGVGTNKPPSSHAAAPAASTDRLAQEVAILSRAGAELHAGRPAAALATLAEHQRKFPHGVLTQERTAARIQALCALGRLQEARSAYDRLARTSPGSPHLARAQKACGFGSASAE